MTVPTYQPTNVCMFTHNTIYNGNYTYSVVGQKPNRRYLGDLNVIAQRGRYWLEKRKIEANVGFNCVKHGQFPASFCGFGNRNCYTIDEQLQD